MAPLVFHNLSDISTDTDGFALEVVTLDRPNLNDSFGVFVASGMSSSAVLVTGIQPGSIAAETLRVGDRIITVNGKPAAGATSTVANFAGKTRLVLTVERSKECAKQAAALYALGSAQLPANHPLPMMQSPEAMASRRASSTIEG